MDNYLEHNDDPALSDLFEDGEILGFFATLEEAMEACEQLLIDEGIEGAEDIG